ncbi:hypothetical protein [Pseudomonas sp. SMN5]|uniref:hypothetical protein n=1 Tax=Pseudomonas sp. SMN5 TaxID=3390198 RepID=UPI003F86134C
MKPAISIVFGLLWGMAGIADATSFGRKATAQIAAIDGHPAICLPDDVEKAFTVGWISLSEGYVRNPGSWGLALVPGAEPLALKAGDCMVFGVVPDGYESNDEKLKTRPLVLQINRTYVFRLTDAYRTRDSYTAVFCIGQTVNGVVEYLQYIRRANGAEDIPYCDSKRNGNIPEQRESLTKLSWPERARG